MAGEIDDRSIVSRKAMRPIYREVIADSTPSILVRVIDGLILESSHITSSMFGYLDDELIGKTIFDLMPDRFRDVHRQHLARYSNSPAVRSMGEAKAALYGAHKSGDEFEIEIILVPTYKLGFLAVVATILKRRPTINSKWEHTSSQP